MEKMKRIIKLNAGVTEFSDNILGGSILLLCGLTNMAVYASAIKLFKVLGNIYKGHLQKLFIDKDLTYLSKWATISQIVNGLFRSGSMLMIPFNLTVGLSLFVFSGFVYGFERALCGLYETIVVDFVTESDVKKRSIFNAEMSIFCSYCRTAGLCLNLLIFLAADRFGIETIAVLYTIIFINGIVKALDVLVSVIERRILVKYILIEKSK